MSRPEAGVVPGALGVRRPSLLAEIKTLHFQSVYFEFLSHRKI